MHSEDSPTVADYLSEQIAACGKTQREIAEEIGYENPNIITMFKQGQTRVPLGKVGPLARALGVDPVYFLRLVMSEYTPETLLAIEDALGSTILTSNERALIKAYRRTTKGTDAVAVIADARDVIAMVMV